MARTTLNLILLLFLCSSFILSTVFAVPSSRSMINPDQNQDPSPKSLFPQGKFKLKNYEGRILQGDRRMDFELEDYSDAGANRSHDPKDPGNG